MDEERKEGKRSDEVHGSCPVRQRGSLNWEGACLGGYIHGVTKQAMSFFSLFLILIRRIPHY